MTGPANLEGPRLYDALIALKPDGLAETEWAVAAGVNRGFFGNLKSKSKNPRRDTIGKLLNYVGKTEADLETDPPVAPKAGARVVYRDRPASAEPDIDMVGIQHIDQAYGMGAVFTESHVDVEVLQFPKVWVETITYSPPALLTWMRGRGDSMLPTIADGDLVLVDRSVRDVREQDAIWAFTVGDVGSIKRLRVKGDRFVILSDNASVPPDEEPQDFVRIVGRVAFVGAKK